MSGEARRHGTSWAAAVSFCVRGLPGGGAPTLTPCHLLCAGGGGHLL